MIEDKEGMEKLKKLIRDFTAEELSIIREGAGKKRNKLIDQAIRENMKENNLA